jgi:hypothetical protein
MMRIGQGWFIAGALVGATVPAGVLAAETASATADEEAAYTRVITERADRIVDPLNFDDAEKATRVRDLIVAQYRGLRDIHDARDAKLAEAKPPGSAAVAEAWTGIVRKEAEYLQFRLHRTFVARLSAELTAEQVEQVKDGMTYGVVPITYRRYLELFPQLTEEQKGAILSYLLEAREYAMDAGSSDEKHGWFRKYKGRINNYLSAAGLDIKQAEKDLAARSRSQ